MTELIEVKSLGRRFGDSWAVRGLSFSVSTGEVVGFLGANGAGKTTTIRMLLGLLHASEGEMILLDEHIPARVETMSRVGSMGEEPDFYPWLSARDNLRVLFDPLGVRRAAMDDAIERVGLGDVAGAKVRTFSHGMRTRLGIARAICGDPEILILDEPTNGLDPFWIRELRTIIADFRASGAAVFLSSHHLTEVEKSCDRVILVAGGRLIGEGRVDELLQQTGWHIVSVRSDDRPRAAEALVGLEYEQISEGFRVRADSGQSVSEALMAHGVAPESLRAEQPSLEGVFFDDENEDPRSD